MPTPTIPTKAVVAQLKRDWEAVPRHDGTRQSQEAERAFSAALRDRMRSDLRPGLEEAIAQLDAAAGSLARAAVARGELRADFGAHAKYGDVTEVRRHLHAAQKELDRLVSG